MSLRHWCSQGIRTAAKNATAKKGSGDLHPDRGGLRARIERVRAKHGRPGKGGTCAQDLGQLEQSSGHVVVWTTEAYNISDNSNLAWRIQQIVQLGIATEASEVCLHQEKDTYACYTHIKNERMPIRSGNQELCTTCAGASLGGGGEEEGLQASSIRISPTSVGEVHSLLPEGPSEKQLQSG